MDASLRRMARSTLGSVALALLICGCQGTQARHLRITEVGRRAVELHLDEPTGSLTLGGSYTLSIRTSTGTDSSIALGTFTQPIPAGGYFMVWSEAGYSGPIVVEPYPGGQQGAVPGIKVPSNTFTDLNNAPTEVRLSGTRNRVSQLVVIIPLFTQDVIDDVVRFGQPDTDRPASGGTFTSNGSLSNPSGSTSLARRFAAATPVDTDAESDWIDAGPTSWGVQTPP